MKHHRTNILETRLGIFLEGDISMVHIIYNNNVLILVYKREREKDALLLHDIYHFALYHICSTQGTYFNIEIDLSIL